jgi:Rha family phage regulatory protein
VVLRKIQKGTCISCITKILNGKGENMNEMVVLGKDGVPVTTSLKIAEVFNLRHENVIKKIKKAECPEKLRSSYYFESFFNDEQGETKLMYEVTYWGFFYIANMFYGKNANKFIEEYLNAFSELEKWKLDMDRAQAEIDYLEKITPGLIDRDTSYGNYKSYKLTDTAGILGFTSIERFLFPSVLRNWGILKPDVKRNFLWYSYENKPYQEYLDAGYFEIKKLRVFKYIPFYKRESALVTIKGLVWLTRIMAVPINENKWGGGIEKTC